MSEAAMLAEAIASVERITTMILSGQNELDRLWSTFTTYRDKTQAARLESIQTISRYRAALDAITRLPVGACDGVFEGDMPEPCDRCGEAHDIARAALEV